MYVKWNEINTRYTLFPFSAKITKQKSLFRQKNKKEKKKFFIHNILNMYDDDDDDSKHRMGRNKLNSRWYEIVELEKFRMGGMKYLWFCIWVSYVIWNYIYFILVCMCAWTWCSLWKSSIYFEEFNVLLNIQDLWCD